MEMYIDNVFSNVPFVESTAIHYNPKTTALKPIVADVKAIKTIENGMVVIRRGDKKYNVIGAEL